MCNTLDRAGVRRGLGIKVTIIGRLDAESVAEMQELYRQLPSACAQLAEKGWPLPLQLSNRQIVGWAQDAPDELDRKFSRWFSANRGERFNSVADSCLARENLAPWHALLEECVTAYRRRQYRVTVPALMAVLEGILLAGCTDSTHVKATVKCHVAAAPHEPHNDLEWVVWSAIDAFITELFKHVRFSGGRPPMLNRHWVLHGRDHQSDAWSQADSLRLFLAVDTVSFMLDEEPV